MPTYNVEGKDISAKAVLRRCAAGGDDPDRLMRVTHFVGGREEIENGLGLGFASDTKAHAAIDVLDSSVVECSYTSLSDTQMMSARCFDWGGLTMDRCACEETFVCVRGLRAVMCVMRAWWFLCTSSKDTQSMSVRCLIGETDHGQVLEQKNHRVRVGFAGFDVRGASSKECVCAALNDMKMMGARFFHRGELIADMHGTDHEHARN